MRVLLKNSQLAQCPPINYLESKTMNKHDIYDILAAVAVGLMLAFFLTIRG